MQIFLFIAIFIAALAVLFAAQNNDPTTVSFFVWHFNSSLALVLLLALATGAAISFLFSLPSNIKVRWTNRQQRKKMSDLETSLESMNAQIAELQNKLDETQKKTAELPEKASAEKDLPAEKAIPAETARKTQP